MVAEWQGSGPVLAVATDRSYREAGIKCEDHGVPVFSPLCDPRFSAAVKQNETQDDIRWGVPKVPPPSPVEPPRPRVAQFDDSASATNFSLDPTYAQRTYTLHPGNILPQDTALPSLALYHKLKRVELDALAKFRDEQTVAQRLAYIKPGDEPW